MGPVGINPFIMSECECAVRKTLLYEQAVSAFDLARAKGGLRRLLAFLSFRSPRLLELNAMKAARSVRHQRYEGLQTVAIQQIRGTENRGNDFDKQFNPVHSSSKERWVNVAIAALEESALPPVELIKVDDIYFVRDGHHRISVAKAFGQEDIDAIVTIWELN